MPESKPAKNESGFALGSLAQEIPGHAPIGIVTSTSKWSCLSHL